MKKDLRSALRKAHKLQAKYNALGSPSTQRVRNPFPMHVLAATVLPVLPNPNSIIPVTLNFSFTFQGKKFVKREMSQEYARDIIDSTVWTKAARSPRQVMADLQAMGYLVGSQGSVTQSLMLARSLGKVASVPQMRALGRPRNLYFATEAK